MATDSFANHTTPTDANLAICLLASGSKGNAIYIAGGSTALLLDAGLSGIEIQRRMQAKGLAAQNLKAILVSHEHSDHVQGVGILSRRFRLPVYINPETHRAAVSRLGKLHELRTFQCGHDFAVGDLAVHPFSTSHDAADPAGFTITRNGTKIGIATDLGIGTGMVRQHLQDCDLLVLEANHDPDMLINGPYPWPLKQRIKGRSGHLSNPESGDLLETLYHPRLKHVILAHLSETNNTPEVAYRTVGPVLEERGVACMVATQDEGSPLIFVD